MATAPESLPVAAPVCHIDDPPQGQWTYGDYTALSADGRHYEIIEGVLYMAPSPGEAHQSANRWFVYYLTHHVQLAGKGMCMTRLSTSSWRRIWSSNPTSLSS